MCTVGKGVGSIVSCLFLYETKTHPLTSLVVWNNTWTGGPDGVILTHGRNTSSEVQNLTVNT